jgi:predicted neuraminidase
MYTAQAAKKPDDNSDDSLQGTAEIRRKISRDGGRTWGPTEAMFTRPGSFCRQKIQVLSNGRWIFNNFICALDGTRLGSDVTVIQISDDQGKTWRGVEIPESRGRVHGNVIELEPGKLVCLLRSRAADHIYRSESNDNGETWSVPVPTPLRNNNASISAIKLQSGALAIIYNDVSFNEDGSRTVWPDQRCPVAMAISEDGGKTWPWRRIVEHGEGFIGPWNDVNNRRYEYPVMMQSKDGKIHAAYAWGRRVRIKYVCVDEAWIRGAKVCKGAEDNPEMPCNR